MSIEEANNSHLNSLVSEKKFNGQVLIVEREGDYFLGWGGKVISPTFKSEQELIEFEEQNRYDIIGTFVFALLAKAHEYGVMEELTKEKEG